MSDSLRLRRPTKGEPIPSKNAPPTETEEDDDDDDEPMSPVPSKSPQQVQEVPFSQNLKPRSNSNAAANRESITKPKKSFSWQNLGVRTITGFLLLCAFYLLVKMGHMYCILLVVAIQTEIYRELVNVRYVAAKERNIPWFRTLQWAWFIVPMIYTYGDQLHKFCRIHRRLSHITAITQHISQISYILYSLLFVTSVGTLKQGHIKHQLSHYMWSIVSVCLVVFQMKFFGDNTLNGLFWFIFPTTLVVFNDIFAYFCGVSMGRKIFDFPLTPMSPNKSWEGFVGAAILTIIFSFYFSDYLSNFEWIICPANNLTFVPFPPAPTCDPNPVFIKTWMDFPLLGMRKYLKPIQLHGLAYGLFASLFAPFGGFYASAIKRAYKIKDFDSVFPGHGGVMDRMDCQLVMVGFTAFHYYSQIAPQQSPTVDSMLAYFAMMKSEDQLALLKEMLEMVNPAK